MTTDSPTLRFRSGSCVDKELAVTPEGCVLGRSHASAVRLDQSIDTLVSGRHVEIRRSDDAWIIEDLDSKNGTWRNGRRIPPRIPTHIEADDEYVLGKPGQAGSVRFYVVFLERRRAAFGVARPAQRIADRSNADKRDRRSR